MRAAPRLQPPAGIPPMAMHPGRVHQRAPTDRLCGPSRTPTDSLVLVPTSRALPTRVVTTVRALAAQSRVTCPLRPVERVRRLSGWEHRVPPGPDCSDFYLMHRPEEHKKLCGPSIWKLSPDGQSTKSS